MSATSYPYPSLLLALLLLAWLGPGAAAATYNVSIGVNITLENSPARAASAVISGQMGSSWSSGGAAQAEISVPVRSGASSSRAAERIIVSPARARTIGEDPAGSILWDQESTAGNYWQEPAREIIVYQTRTVTVTATQTYERTVPLAPQEIGSSRSAAAVAAALLIPLLILGLAALARGARP